jgi:hypothetical protein
MIKKLKNLGIIFLTALLTFVAANVTIGSFGKSTYALDEVVGYKQILLDGGLALERWEYHNKMNEFFNIKFGQLTTLINKNPDDFYDKKDFKAPSKEKVAGEEDLAVILEECGPANVSTYCVSMGALTFYMAYIERLDSIQDSAAMPGFRPSEDVFDFLPGGVNPSVEGVLRETAARNEQIKAEVKEARQVMEAAVAVYNEFRFAYPAHEKYRQIIRKLTKYKLVLKDIRKRAMLFPTRFIDASSSECK